MAANSRPYGAARVFAEQQLGGPTRENETNPTVQTTVGVLVGGNPDRVGLVIVNQGANDIFIAVSSGVSTNNGIRLSSNGGNTSMVVRDDFTLPSRTWYAIASGGSSAVYVLELISDIVTPATESA